jgi:hypothetical protein
MNYNNFNPNIDLLNKAKLLRRKERANSIIPHYDASEKRFTHYKKEIPQVWNDTYHNTPLGDVKIIVGTRNNPNLSKELIRKSPYIKKSKNNRKPTINQMSFLSYNSLYSFFAPYIHIEH